MKKNRLSFLTVFLVGTFIFGFYNANLNSFATEEEKKSSPHTRGWDIGMLKKNFYRHYPKHKACTYRSEHQEDWITYHDPIDSQAENMITFHFKDEKLVDWSLNNREEIVREYLGEFSSQFFIQSSPKIYTALQNALQKLPREVFCSITDRSRPVLFTEYHTTGTGRFANSSEIIATDDDVPAFQNGLTIVKLSTELEGAQEEKAIEGVILHELAHRFLEHGKKELHTCEMEKEANHLVMQWGFGDEFQKAKETFGRPEKGTEAPCGEGNE